MMRSSCAALAGAALLAAGPGHARAQGASFALENDDARVNRNAAPCVAAVAGQGGDRAIIASNA